ncbi:hypothetical protein [Magnetospirillum sp. 15-1]|uniref:hypothetical protein n=1 Tax=Magnetospirillum sp. 15-1 TaxID=1979370 RepID=UPI001482FCAC|nr:hypothetical protein [Magnetospirillum sp. 15-1]
MRREKMEEFYRIVDASYEEFAAIIDRALDDDLSSNIFNISSYFADCNGDKVKNARTVFGLMLCARVLADFIDLQIPELIKNFSEGTVYGDGTWRHLPPEIKRNILEQYLRTIGDWRDYFVNDGAGSKFSGFFELAEALQALRHGETQLLLEAKTTGNQGESYSLWNLRKDAVRYVIYKNERHPKKRGKEKARADVAELFGVSSRTVRSWEERLPNFLGEKNYKIFIESVKDFTLNTSFFDRRFTKEELEKVSIKYKIHQRNGYRG